MARDICCVCAKSVIPSEFAQRRNELRKIMDDLHIKLKENALMCPPCLEKIDKIYNFKMSFLKSKNNIMVENSAILNNLNKTSRNGALEEDLHNQNIRICRLCKTSNVDSVSYRDFLENNNMQSIYGDHFPEIKFHYSKHWVICKNCINGLKDFMDIKLKLNIDKPSVHNPNQEGKQKQLFVRLVNLNLSTHMTTVDSRPSRYFHKIVSSNATKTTDKRFQKVNKDNFSTTSKTKKSHMLSLDSYIMNEQNKESNYQSKKTLPLVLSSIQYLCQDSKVDARCNHEIPKKHVTQEPGMFYCAQCDYKSINKRLLRIHMKAHKTPFETKMFQCGECNYKTKYLYSLKSHQITHKSPEETVMYKCDYCSFESKYKSSTKQHVKIHKSKDECETYDCHYCDFRGKSTGNLRCHLISHQTPEDTRWYGCEKCHFKTRYKTNLRRHLIVHQSVDEAKMIKCQFCDYESKHFASVKKHLLCHDTDDIQIFKCSDCTYETKHKNNYKRHLLTHKKYGEAPMIKCPDCDYQTNYKYYMTFHRETQHDPLAKRYSCPDCEYKTAFSGNMTKHLVIHRSGKKAILYNCDYCEFKSKHKDSIKLHLLIHRPETAKMFECPYCDHKTKVKYSLKCHVSSKHGKPLTKNIEPRTHMRKFKTPTTLNNF